MAADQNLENFERIKELTKERLLQRRRKRQTRLLWQVALCSAVVLSVCSIAAMILQKQSDLASGGSHIIKIYKVETPPEIIMGFEDADCGMEDGLNDVQALVLHDSSDVTIMGDLAGKCHFFIDEYGKITQYMPLNTDQVEIVCDIDTTEGKLTEKTYDALAALTAWLIGQADLNLNDVLRHYDGEKIFCPEYFVENESAWEDFKIDVEKYIETHGVKK